MVLTSDLSYFSEHVTGFCVSPHILCNFKRLLIMLIEIKNSAFHKSNCFP